MYFPTLDAGGLVRFTLTPARTRHLRVNPAPEPDVWWLVATLNREGRRFGTRVSRLGEQDLLLQWVHA